jgi:voltage-gated potassium channel Kch
MTWSQLSAVVEWAMLIWFFSILAIIIIQMIRGRIILSGLLGPERITGLRLHRLQLIVVTVIFAGAYLVQAISLAPGEPLPNVPPALLAAILGSHGIYLGGKIHQYLAARGAT